MFLLAILLLIAALGCAYASSSVAYQKKKVAGVWINVVTIDLNDPHVSITPAISKYGIGSCESFRSLLRRTRPAAAINGTFFDTRTLVPTGDIVIDGQLLHKGYLGVAIAIRNGNEVRFIPSRHPDMYQWTDHDAVLVGGPTLITEGKTVVVPRAEGFRSGVHFTKRLRAAVGLTYSNKLLMVTTRRPVLLSTLARVMRTLHCHEAAVLDGGSSIGLYCKGKLVKNPKVGMTNCLLVYDDLEAYNRRRSCFYPGEQAQQDG